MLYLLYILHNIIIIQSQIKTARLYFIYKLESQLLRLHRIFCFILHQSIFFAFKRQEFLARFRVLLSILRVIEVFNFRNMFWHDDLSFVFRVSSVSFQSFHSVVVLHVFCPSIRRIAGVIRCVHFGSQRNE